MVYPRLIAAVVICLFLSLTAATPALAATEAWVADPRTGGKICIVYLADGITIKSATWSGPLADGKAEGQGQLNYTYKDKSGKEIKAQADAEMKAGKLDGRVSVKWSDGDTYEGFYKAGLRDGQGVFKFANGQSYDGDWKAGHYDGQGVFRWPNGAVYEGDWRNDAIEGKGVFKYNDGQIYEGDFLKGQRHGQGVLRDAAGKIVYEGEWQGDQPATGPLKADKILGVPWGASEDETKKIMLARPGTYFHSAAGGPDSKWHAYMGPYNEETARILVYFYKGRMYCVEVDHFYNEDQIMPRFEAIKGGLTDRYGQPYHVQGKYLDSKAYWDLGGGYNAAVSISNRSAFMNPQAVVPDFMRRPFSTTITYWHRATLDLANLEAKKKASKDY